MPNGRWRGAPWGFVVAAIAVVIGCAIAFWSASSLYNARLSQGGASPAAPSVNQPMADAGMSDLRHTAESFRSVAKLVGAAVVNVKSTHGQKGGGLKGLRQRRWANPDQDDDQGSSDPFFDFFQQFGQPFLSPQPDVVQTSLGSGILIAPEGLIVTNNHVIEGASEIVVTLAQDQNAPADLKAKVIGTDKKTDLAVLKLSKSGTYPTAQWADSDAVEVGDWAIAIGSPFALGNSVTLGIVSAKGRNAQGLTGSEYGGDLIQTDAAINPGNSGGPLCDVDGKVMGVNTAIYTRSGGYMGIGFAIPSNLAREVVGKLLKGGKVVRGWLGIYIQPLDPELAAELGIRHGAAIHEVIQDSPAAKAGLVAGDVIVEIDGKPILDANQLQRVIGNDPPGQTVKIKVVSYNDKKARLVSVKIGTLPEKQSGSAPPREEAPDKLGLIVSAARGGGVTVDAIQPNSFADQQLDLQVGDVLVRMNRKPIDSVATYRKLLKASQQIALEVRRGTRTLFFRFTLP